MDKNILEIIDYTGNEIDLEYINDKCSNFLNYMSTYIDLFKLYRIKLHLNYIPEDEKNIFSDMCVLDGIIVDGVLKDVVIFNGNELYIENDSVQPTGYCRMEEDFLSVGITQILYQADERLLSLLSKLFTNVQNVSLSTYYIEKVNDYIISFNYLYEMKDMNMYGLSLKDPYMIKCIEEEYFNII